MHIKNPVNINHIKSGEFIVLIREENANQEIYFNVKDNREGFIEELPDDGNQIIIFFQDFSLYTIFKKSGYLQSPKYIMDSDNNLSNDISYKKLWERLGYKSGDKFILRTLIPRRVYECN